MAETDRSRGCRQAAKSRQNTDEQRGLSDQGLSPPWGQVRGQVKPALNGRVSLFIEDGFFGKIGSQVVHKPAPLFTDTFNVQLIFLTDF
jgi:hypothetical protein